MSEPDPKSIAELLRERNERTYARFNELSGFPRERMDWIQWLWDLHRLLGPALQFGDTQDGVEADLRADAAAQVTDLLYHDARGSTPWGSNTPATATGAARVCKWLEAWIATAQDVRP